MFLYSYFGLCEYSQSPWVSFVTTDSSQWGLQKFNSFLTKWNDPTSKAHKPHNFQSNNSLKLGFFNIGCLPLNLIGCESFLESNSPAILPLCETNLDDSIDFGTSPVRSYLLSIWKDFVTHMQDLAVYVKVMIRTCNFPDDSEDSYFCFQLALLHPVFFVFSFSLLSSSFSSLMLFHLTYMRLSQSNNLLIYMFLKTLTFIIKTA